MRFIVAALAMMTALINEAGGQAPSGPAAPPFFNGKDLNGWESLPGYWSVKDGAIVGATPAAGLSFNTFLCSTRKYRDFELKFQVRLKDSVGNSGVQIRSEVFDPKKMAVRGPQCDIGDIYWGSLYGEHFADGMMQQAPKDIVTKVLKKDDFNEYHIKCVGKRVTIKLNNETTVDGEFPKMPDEGIIAFQLHAGPKMEVTFRNIEFKDLSGK